MPVANGAKGAKVWLYHAGEAIASAVVRAVHADGIDLHVSELDLALGTYLEVELVDGCRGPIGTMITARTGDRLALAFASWNPRVFELIDRLAAEAYAAPLFEPQPAAAARNRIDHPAFESQDAARSL